MRRRRMSSVPLMRLGRSAVDPARVLKIEQRCSSRPIAACPRYQLLVFSPLALRTMSTMRQPTHAGLYLRPRRHSHRVGPAQRREQ